MGGVDAKVVGAHGGHEPVGRDRWARRTRLVTEPERPARPYLAFMQRKPAQVLLISVGE